MLVALLLGVAAHAIVWFLLQTLLGQTVGAAWYDAKRQGFLSLTWMICALAYWTLNTPRSRKSATFQVLLAALLVTLAGSIGAFFKMWLGPQSVNVLGFWFYGLWVAASQLILSVPSALALQALALRKTPLESADT